jgi:hypothetical protein
LRLRSDGNFDVKWVGFAEPTVEPFNNVKHLIGIARVIAHYATHEGTTAATRWVDLPSGAVTTRSMAARANVVNSPDATHVLDGSTPALPVVASARGANVVNSPDATHVLDGSTPALPVVASGGGVVFQAKGRNCVPNAVAQACPEHFVSEDSKAYDQLCTGLGLTDGYALFSNMPAGLSSVKQPHIQMRARRLRSRDLRAGMLDGTLVEPSSQYVVKSGVHCFAVRTDEKNAGRVYETDPRWPDPIPFTQEALDRVLPHAAVFDRVYQLYTEPLSAKTQRKRKRPQNGPAAEGLNKKRKTSIMLK